VRLLLTRPQPAAERTAAVLRARGHAVLLAPLLRIEPLGFALPDEPVCAVVMTSANAAAALAAHPARDRLAALPAFTTGRRSAEAARAAGFAEVHSADGDKDDLARLLRTRLAGTRLPLLYLAGADRAGEIGLADCGLRTIMRVVYRAVAAERFPAAVAEALTRGTLDGVLHFSRRTAEAFVDCAGAGGILAHALVPAHFCLSGQVAEPIRSAGAVAIRVAPRPDEAALLALVGRVPIR
jgi:uroporphyrinogen-III synthase